MRTKGKYILDAEGQPVEERDLLKWATWFETADKTVMFDEVGGSKISTVFLGLDMSFGGKHPQLFETRVFGGPLNTETDRYATREEAIAGHAFMVQRVKVGGK